ncbi:RDD family protein [Streptomyces sp. NPDC005808]|uniref:RDD family protein n=1 Tax=Streptomyces sp. NPDC005808 TaxID=3364734 RepID=UPI0036CC6329
MSAPTPAPGDDRPREGYYPDPSIPGYVRYWNGAAWVPGTSRPAPSDGVPPATPAASVPAQAQEPPLAEQTGPYFFDEDPQQSGGARQVSPAEAQHGSRPEPAAAWGADRSQQSGFGRGPDRRVSWGAPGTADPRVPRASDPADPVVQPDGRSSRTDGTATIPPADSGGPRPPASGGSVVFRRPTGPVRPAGAEGAGDGTPGAGRTAGPSVGRTAGSSAGPSVGSFAGPSVGSGAEGLPSEGTMTFRPHSPRTAPEQGSARPAASSAGGGFGAGQAAAAQAAQAATAQPAAQAAPAPAPAAAQNAAVPQQAGGTPTTSGIGGGQPSWAQQVHRLAGEEGQPVAPWKPPVEDIFTAAARRQSAARPAGLGRRLAARLVDTVVLAGVTAVAAVPLGTKAVDHINAKVDAAKLSGEAVTVWLLDGTTAGYLGIVLAVLLLFGVLYDALPTARWGCTLGKKLCGIDVRDIEGHEPPTFGSALRRWLVYAVTGVLGVGVLGVLWCLFDKPWRQCWHDKAAHTFVAARS